MTEKIKYAVPYNVDEITEYLCAEKGLVGYNIGVRFNGLSNFPTPHFFDCENMHMYQDVNAGTSRVVYHFPFVGHGLINFGKLRAEHWYKKMKKQVDAYNAQQQIKR